MLAYGMTKDGISSHHPLHYITFDPGDIWFFNAQWITHQIIFGAKLQCYEADITRDSLQNPSMCLKDRIRCIGTAPTSIV